MVVIQNELLPYFEWLFQGTEDSIGALWFFLLFLLCASLAGLAFGFIVATIRHGPMVAGDLTYRVMKRAGLELISISPRRVWALAKLAFQESLRRRVFVVLGIYVVLLGFASWFLTTELAEPAKLQISFVMTATNYLVLIMALFLSTFSLPTDFKNRTIYTVVTKPVYAGEIILGRLIGFTMVGTLLLAAMTLISYAFVVRSLSHTHTIDEATLIPVASRQGASSADAGGGALRQGSTSRDQFHRHEVTLDAEGNGTIQPAKGHTHEVKNHVVGPALDLFQARVPKFGKLTFKSATGEDKPRGISVGNEWDYLSYIEGGTQSAAIWTFEGITEAEYPEGLPIEMYIRVFRSYKGDINKGILGSIRVRNPDTKLQSEVIQTFRAKDFDVDEKFIRRQLKGKRPGEADVKDYDLFADFVTSGDGDPEKAGRLEIEIQCLDRAQYYGVAQGNLYLRAQGGNFELNFLKGYVGIWAQMILVICFGVLFSSFLSGPVALLATVGCALLGFFSQDLADIVSGQALGGGPFEALIRTVTHANLTQELERTAGVVLAQALDKVAIFFMTIWFYVLPDFATFDNINWVADGFNIPNGQIGQHLSVAFAYFVGAYLAGYFCLRLREVGQ